MNTIDVLIRYCEMYGFSESSIQNIKSHSFNQMFICDNCNVNTDFIRAYITSVIKNNVYNEILSCDEVAIKKILE